VGGRQSGRKRGPFSVSFTGRGRWWIARGAFLRLSSFVLLLAAAVAWQSPAPAQPLARPVIGVLCGGTPESDAYRISAFRSGLREAGYLEGQNVLFEYRCAEQHYDRLQSLAADLVARNVTLIVAMGGIPSAVAAKPATATIPILIAIGGDPVQLGLVASLNRPGGNITGVTFLINAMGAKQLEVLREGLPKTPLIAFLGNPANPNAQTDSENVLRAAQTLGQELLMLQASTDDELAAAFATLAQRQAGGLVVGADFFLVSRRDKIVQLADERKVPAIYPLREFAESGGLMSYGTSLGDGYRLIGQYAARILKGEKPADLPVQQSTKVELVINLKAARTLGLTLPITLLGRADEVIE
jgi:putative tryptophan/tyrosine transport system substrate-binding protein